MGNRTRVSLPSSKTDEGKRKKKKEKKNTAMKASSL